jgi:4-hydroxy-tetrahydrodipicolinate reductase
LNEFLANMMNAHNQYNVHIDEIHHTEKKDAPSGTAITLAQGILKHINRLTKWVGAKSAERSELPISSFRIDQVPGTHHVKYASGIDDIEIRHTAHSREGFALGAVQVAEWIPGKKGVLGMEDFLQF